MNIDLESIKHTREQTDERKGMKTITGNICKKCAISKIIPTEIISTSVLKEYPTLEYTDTQKNIHIHNMNVLVHTYRCSNDHEWIVNISMNKCWCVVEKNTYMSTTDSPRFDCLRNSPIARVSPRHKSNNT
jgi:hypothetical protein